MNPTTIAAWLGILVTVGGALASSVKFAFWVFDEWRQRRRHEGFAAPTDALRLAPMPEGHCWWAMGKMGDEPTMQIVGRMFVTNIASVPVRIPQVELRYGLFGRKLVSGMAMVSRGPRDNMHGTGRVNAFETTVIQHLL